MKLLLTVEPWHSLLHNLRFFFIQTGLLLRHIKDHKLTVLCMHVVENILYSGSADTVVQSHNINTGELVRSYTGHTMSVSGVQALGGVLVTSSLDRIIRCFDIKV